MTIITLPPDLEERIADQARRRGTTPELLAIDGLRQFFASASPGQEASGGETLFDFLGDYIGAVDGSPEPMSEDCGRRFAEGLAEQERRAGS